MADLNEIARFLDGVLRTPEVPDSDRAFNGLQLANGGSVSRIAAAVDFSLTTVTQAIEERADLLLVHHGIFWRTERMVGAAYERLRAAFSGNLAVYSSHIPLDLHPDFGNNSLLARELALTTNGGFGRYKGVEIGVCGDANLPTQTLVARCSEFAKRSGGTAVSTPFPGGRTTRRWAIVTGMGASPEFLAEARERGVDTLVVGEGTHHSAVQAIEDGIVVVYTGHYATETLGVRTLAQFVGERFGVPWTFVDAPTGL